MKKIFSYIIIVFVSVIYVYYCYGESINITLGGETFAESAYNINVGNDWYVDCGGSCTTMADNEAITALWTITPDDLSSPSIYVPEVFNDYDWMFSFVSCEQLGAEVDVKFYRDDWYVSTPSHTTEFDDL